MTYSKVNKVQKRGGSGRQKDKTAGRNVKLVNRRTEEYTEIHVSRRHCVDRSTLPKGWGKPKHGIVPYDFTKVTASSLGIETKLK